MEQHRYKVRSASCNNPYINKFQVRLHNFWITESYSGYKQLQKSLKKLDRVNEKFQLNFKNGKCPGGWVEQDLGVFVDSCLRISS